LEKPGCTGRSPFHRFGRNADKGDIPGVITAGRKPKIGSLADPISLAEPGIAGLRSRSDMVRPRSAMQFNLDEPSRSTCLNR
jgi:hypothetical protein